jgi:hypothetical protein
MITGICSGPEACEELFGTGMVLDLPTAAFHGVAQTRADQGVIFDDGHNPTRTDLGRSSSFGHCGKAPV